MNKLNLKTKITTLWHRLKASRDYDSTKMVVNPFRDWRRLLSWWLVFLLFILGAATYLSWRINTLQITLSPEEVAVGVEISPSLVTKAKQSIDARALRFEQNWQTPPISIDPGL